MSICWSGPPIQWSADPTEHAHIDAIKIPSENTNNGQYGPQICQYLDHDEKHWLFDLATAIQEAGGDLLSIIYGVAGNQKDDDNEAPDDKLNEGWITKLDTVGRACTPSCKTVNLFAATDTLLTHVLSEDSASIVWPLWTFSTSWATFQLNWWPDITQVSVDSLTKKYKLPHFQPALLNFLTNHLQNPLVHQIGGQQRTQVDTQLPFNNVMVWFSLHIQTQSLDSNSVIKPQCLMVMPPCDLWPLQRYDAMLFVHDSANLTPSPDVRLEGKCTNYISKHGRGIILLFSALIAYISAHNLIP